MMMIMMMMTLMMMMMMMMIKTTTIMTTKTMMMTKLRITMVSWWLQEYLSECYRVPSILLPEVVACADPDICMEQCDNEYGCTNIAYPILVQRILPVGTSLYVRRFQSLERLRGGGGGGRAFRNYTVSDSDTYIVPLTAMLSCWNIIMVTIFSKITPLEILQELHMSHKFCVTEA